MNEVSVFFILRGYKRGGECASYNRYLYKARRSGGCFNRSNGGLFDAVAVAFPLPYCLSFKYTGSDPARNRCIVYSQTLCYLWRCEIFLFHVRKNVLTYRFLLLLLRPPFLPATDASFFVQVCAFPCLCALIPP